jgi:hypothetical protein
MAMFATGVSSTTLGGAAAQTANLQGKPRSGRALKFGLAGGLAAVIAVVVAMNVGHAPPQTVPGSTVAQAPAAAPQGPAAPSAAPQSSPAAVAPQPPSAAPQAPGAGEGSAPATPPTAAGGASGQPAVPSGAPTQPAKPAVQAISITVGSTPPGARVFVGGEPTARGTTPFVLEGARDAAPIEVRLVLPGYRPHKRLIEFERDREISIVLDKLSGPGAAAKPTSPVPAAAKPAGAAPAVAKPAETAPPATKPAETTPPAVKPAVHDDRDDPMDPFARKPQKADGQKKEGP